jgi:hypothetical protein
VVVLVVKNHIPTIPPPQYSPDVALCDFWLIVRIKIGLKGHVLSAEEMQQNSTAGLTAIPKQDFQRGLQWSDCRSGVFVQKNSI